MLQGKFFTTSYASVFDSDTVDESKNQDYWYNISIQMAKLFKKNYKFFEKEFGGVFENGQKKEWVDKTWGALESPTMIFNESNNGMNYRYKFKITPCMLVSKEFGPHHSKIYQFFKFGGKKNNISEEEMKNFLKFSAKKGEECIKSLYEGFFQFLKEKMGTQTIEDSRILFRVYKFNLNFLGIKNNNLTELVNIALKNMRYLPNFLEDEKYNDFITEILLNLVESNETDIKNILTEIGKELEFRVFSKHISKDTSDGHSVKGIYCRRIQKNYQKFFGLIDTDIEDDITEVSKAITKTFINPL